MKSTVLLINEDSYSLFITKKVIETIAPGVKVVTCKQVDELALFLHHYAANQNYPYLIFADFNYSVKNEWNYLSILSAVSGYTRIIATGISEDDVDLLKKHNISEYLIKPITVKDLERKILK